MLNNILCTSTENETHKFDRYISDSSKFIDSAEKDDTVNHANATSLSQTNESDAIANHSNEKNIFKPEEIACRIPNFPC